MEKRVRMERDYVFMFYDFFFFEIFIYRFENLELGYFRLIFFFYYCDLYLRMSGEWDL